MRQLSLPTRFATEDGKAVVRIHHRDLTLLRRELQVYASTAPAHVRDALTDLVARLAPTSSGQSRLQPAQFYRVVVEVGRSMVTRPTVADHERRLAVLRALMPVLSEEEQQAVRREYVVVRDASKRRRRTGEQ